MAADEGLLLATDDPLSTSTCIHLWLLDRLVLPLDDSSLAVVGLNRRAESHDSDTELKTQ